MLSPVRSRPPGDEEWSLLSSCIGDMEETDLLAFDEDLADASVWEENDMGTGPDGAMLPAPPAPRSPGRAWHQQGGRSARAPPPTPQARWPCCPSARRPRLCRPSPSRCRPTRRGCSGSVAAGGGDRSRRRRHGAAPRTTRELGRRRAASARSTLRARLAPSCWAFLRRRCCGSAATRRAGRRSRARPGPRAAPARSVAASPKTSSARRWTELHSTASARASTLRLRRRRRRRAEASDAARQASRSLRAVRGPPHARPPPFPLPSQAWASATTAACLGW